MKYNIYIPSKDRAEHCLTAEILKLEKIDFKIVIEPQDEEKYHKKYPNILVMDKNNQGIAYVRNWIKKYSISKKEAFHWQIDDNIRGFKIRENKKNKKNTALYCLSYVENYIGQFKNIGIAGLSHHMFAFSRHSELGINQQCYSCVLVRNDLPIWWRPNLMEDTDYSLQVLTLDDFKWCTILFFRLLIEKLPTMALKGGNTEIEYKSGGRARRSAGLMRQWPNFFKVKLKYGDLRIMPSRIWSKFPQRPIKNG